MSAGGSACAVVSSFGRRTCNACAYAPRNRTGKDAGAGKTTTASEKPCTALIVVSGAVARSPGEAAPSHREPLDVNQTDSVRNGATPTRATWPSTGAAGTRCRLCGCASVGAAGATITTLPPLGYWRAWHAACSGAHACEGRTTNTELGGRALRQPTKKPAGRAFRWAVGGSSSEFLACHACAPADAVELAPLVEFDGRIIDIPPPRLCDWLQVLRLHVAVLV